jgi:hypothetical protein
MDIERSDYKVTVPDGSTVDDEDPDIDLDHYTAVNLPNGDTLTLLTLDDLKYADKEFDKLKSGYWTKVQQPEELPSDLFAARGAKAGIVTGKINGMRFCFEFGQLLGAKRAFLLSCIYERNHPEVGRVMFQQAIESFIIKE